MTRPVKTATLEGPNLRRKGEYRVVKTRNTLEIKPQDHLTEVQVEDMIRQGRIDITFIAPKR